MAGADVTTWIALALVVGAALGWALVARRRRAADEFPRVPWREGSLPPGPGWTLFQVADEGLFWVEAHRIKPGPVRSDLSDAQIARIRAFKERLGDLDRSSLETTLEDFSRDRNPDNEIRIWERIAAVVEAELAARGFVEADERVLIFKAVLGCSNTEPRVEVLLTAYPRLNALRDLEQVVERWRGFAG